MLGDLEASPEPVFRVNLSELTFPQQNLEPLVLSEGFFFYVSAALDSPLSSFAFSLYSLDLLSVV